MLGVTTIFVTHDQREALSMSDKIVVMKDGRKQQEGGPEAVYNKPANHFVADFLGHSNFMHGTVDRVEGDAVVVALADGSRLTSSSGGDWRTGQPVEVVVRAQRFEPFLPDEYQPEPGANHFSGRIRDRSYMGGEVSYFVEIAGGAEIHIISMMRSRIYQIGDEVSVQVSPHHCHLLAPEEATQSATSATVEA